MQILKNMIKLMGFNTQGDLGGLTTYTSRRTKLVVFPRAPPLNPPSLEQEYQRNQIRNVARTWSTLSANQKAEWKTAADRARLRMTGYNLYTYWSLTNDAPTVKTIERLTGTSLI